MSMLGWLFELERQAAGIPRSELYIASKVTVTRACVSENIGYILQVAMFI